MHNNRTICNLNQGSANATYEIAPIGAIELRQTPMFETRETRGTISRVQCTGGNVHEIPSALPNTYLILVVVLVEYIFRPQAVTETRVRAVPKVAPAGAIITRSKLAASKN